MLLEKFALPKTDERLITIDNTIFKIKIHLVKQPNRNEKSYEEFCSNPKRQEEIEKIMIVLLTSKDDPQPIRTNNLTVYPYRKKWEIAHILQFYRNKAPLKTCPYVHYFYIEPKLALSKKHCLENRKQCENNGTPVQNNTKQTTYHSQTDQGNKTQEGTRTINQINYKAQKKASEKRSDKMQSPAIAKNTDQIQIFAQSVNKHKQLAPNSTMDKAYDESESEDNQSVSILDGIQLCDVSSPETDLSPERLSSSGDESLVYSTARNQVACSQPETRKQDIVIEVENMKTCKPIKLIPASATIRQTRKRRGEVLDEAEPKRKNYSVTEYLDANRHDVQEQDLQELLRFQQLATPAEEKPAVEERRHSSLQRVFSSVKKLMFG